MNRNNCGCTPSKPFANRTDFLKELYETCDCVLPCESCECVEQTGTCPPPPPCKPVQRMKCCVDKPKKGFWQLLFGGKICSPRIKKKQDKKSQDKQATKLKCVPLPNSNNALCEDNVKSEQPGSQFNSSTCPRKECFPTPKSICGCHFYFNIENRTRRRAMTFATKDKQISENNETPFEYSYDINEEPERDNLVAGAGFKGDKVNSPTRKLSSQYNRRSSGNKNTLHGYSTQNKRQSSYEGRKTSTVAFDRSSGPTRRSNGFSYNNQRRSSLCNRKRKSNCFILPAQTEEPIRIGLTVTKEETKYLVPNNDTCLSSRPEQNSSDDCKNSQGNSSTDNSEQLITVEIHKSGVNVSNNDDVIKVDSPDVLDDGMRKKSVPQSESLSRELMPMMKRKGPIHGQIVNRLSISEDESEQNIYTNLGHRNTKRQSLVSKGCSKANLDSRVSEILKKLNDIENKINVIEKKEQSDKKIRVDFDGAKSTVSLHIKDPSRKKADNGYKCTTNSKNITGNTVIEIRHSQSKSSSPVRRSFQENELRSSQSLDDCEKSQPSSHKIVIKLPKHSTETKCFVFPEKQDRNINENCKQTDSWNVVSNKLKCFPLAVANQCYCFECVQKRLRCL